MRILLDARPALGGMARYVAALHAQLGNALSRESVETFGRAALGWGGTGAGPAPFWRRAMRPVAGPIVRAASDHVRLPLRAAPGRVDLFHATFNVVPAGLRVPTVMTLHDLWGLHHAGERPRGWRTGYERRALRSGLRRADHVMAVSRAMARELIEYMDVDPSRVTAIHPLLQPPADPDPQTPGRLGIGDRFLLSVGTLEPRKNLERLFAAQQEVFARTGMPLVMAGARGWRDEELLRVAADAGPAIRLAGYVTDTELSWLYSHADAVVQFSRYEGFDYPVAEALRAGRALVLSDIEVHREVAGTAATYVPPDDPSALAGALMHLAEMSDAHRAQAGELARRRFAEVCPADAVWRYIECYRRVLGAGPEPG